MSKGVLRDKHIIVIWICLKNGYRHRCLELWTRGRTQRVTDTDVLQNCCRRWKNLRKQIVRKFPPLTHLSAELIQPFYATLNHTDISSTQRIHTDMHRNRPRWYTISYIVQQNSLSYSAPHSKRHLQLLDYLELKLTYIVKTLYVPYLTPLKINP